jgi:hypothetical protein
MSRRFTRQYLEKVRVRYAKACRDEKGWILDDFCRVCGCHRKYAIRLLNRPPDRPRKRSGPRPRYGADLLKPLTHIWLASDQLCSKRLKAALPHWLPHYERHWEPLQAAARQKLLAISPATIDRLLRPIRGRYRRKRLSGTRPGTLLRNQIPLRTDFTDVDRPGQIEADTVAHSGNSMGGNFIWSLTFTDLWSGWTETRAVWNKGARGVVDQVREVEARLPFPILAFHCDNGSEFLNHHLWRYFAGHPHKPAFTRTRPYRHNDNAHVEQKQWTHVRELLGYDRFDNPAVLRLINDLYRHEWSLYQNYFRPSLKLLDKERINSRTRRRYEALPKTPCQRLLECDAVSTTKKQRLRDTYATLDPFALKKTIEAKLRRIFKRNRATRHGVGAPPKLYGYGKLLP